MKLSAIVLTKNEEKNLPACLKSLGFADEIIVIDNNSTDKTLSIARKYTDKIYSFKGLDFSGMRNLGREKAKHSWLFYLDADELVSTKLAQEIEETLLNPLFSAYRLDRHNYFFGQKWPTTEKMIRLMKKDMLVGWFGPLHETPRMRGSIGQLTNPLYHYTHQNITAMVVKTNLWSEIEADLRLKSHHAPIIWWRFFRVMLTAFYDSYIKQAGYKLGTVGLIESIYQAFSIFITYAKLWEKQNRKS